MQIVATGGEARLYSRTGDDIGQSFPDVIGGMHFNAVLDGELLVVRNGEVAPFNDLQQRLNRKGVTRKQLEQFPAHVRLYDALIIEGEDLRALPFMERRAHLEAWFAKTHPPRTDLSPLIDVAQKDELQRLWSETRATSIEGIMLKRRASRYVAGRPKGEWYKWKRAPLTLDCVLMYAQRGSGKRSSYYSDYTFGAWRTDPENGAQELVPVGKAYFGFTDEELLQIDRWVRNHTTESFGPGARGDAGAGVRGGLRCGAEIDAAQVGRGHALSAHPSHPLGQAGRGGGPAGDAGGDDRRVSVRLRARDARPGCYSRNLGQLWASVQTLGGLSGVMPR